MGWIELADTSFWWGKFERTRMLELVRPLFAGSIIANGGIDPETANALIRSGAVDAVSFGQIVDGQP